jgi:hypothetical protein
MKRMWTIIGVADVPQSFKWYQSLLGLPEAAPAHDYFGQIVDSAWISFCLAITRGNQLAIVSLFRFVLAAVPPMLMRTN